MTGAWEVVADTPHRCRPPKYNVTPGSIWCCDCGRRWSCFDDVTEYANMVGMYAQWRRRWWPWLWPRPATRNRR